MKNVLLNSIVIVLFVIVGNAQEKEIQQEFDFKSGSITTFFNKEVIEYQFKSLDDLGEGIMEIIKGVDIYNSENKKESCEVIFELKLEIVKEKATILISEKITANCEEIHNEAIVKRLKTLLLAATG